MKNTVGSMYGSLNKTSWMYIRIYEAIRASHYVKWIKRNKGLLFACVIISTFLCVLTYPGILYSDSYNRISFASSLKMAIHAFAQGDTDLMCLNSWLTVVPSFFILLSKELVGSIVLYTFLQSFLFLAMVYIFGNSMSQSGLGRGWSIICITLTPVIWGYSVYYEASVGCAAAIMLILLFIWKYDSMENRVDKVLSFILSVFASFICFGYRANAFTILPALFIIIMIKYRKEMQRIFLIAAICLGFALTSIIPNVLNINTMSSFAASFVWETVSAIQTLDEEKQFEYSTYLDDIFGEGATKVAIDNSQFAEQESSINDLFSEKISRAELSAPGNPGRILEKYFDLIRNEPEAYLKTKWEFISHSLGIGKSINFAEYNYNRWDSMGQFGFNDSKPRKVFVDYTSSYMKFMEVFRRPWIMFLTAFVLLIMHRGMFGKKKGMSIQEASYLVALFYYGAYVINTQSFEFRYYFPSWLLLFIIIISLAADIGFRKTVIKKQAPLILAIIFGVCFFGGYDVYTDMGDQTIENVKTQGKIIYEDAKNKVYYLDNRIYFLSNPGADTDYMYFLHYYPVEGEMINNDFSFEDKKLPSSFWSEKIAVTDIPKQSLSCVGFGQYYGNTRFWETSIGIEVLYGAPESIIVSDYSDNDWTNGYSNTENCFLLNDLSASNYLLKGKNIKLPNGSTAQITDVVEVAGYMRIYTDIKIVDFNIREYQVVE